MKFHTARILQSGLLVVALVALPRIAAAQAAAPHRPAPSRVAKAATRPASLVQAASLPQPTGGNLVVAIEVRETAPGATAKTERFTVPLTEHGHAKIDSRVGDTVYRIGVHIDGPDASWPLDFAVEKSQHGPGPRSESAVHASVRIKARQRVVIARMDRSDGSRTEVIAELK